MNKMNKRFLGLLLLFLVVSGPSAWAQKLKFNGFSGTLKTYFYDFDNSSCHVEFDVDGDDNSVQDAQYKWFYFSSTEINVVEGSSISVAFDNNTKPSPHVTIDYKAMANDHLPTSDFIVYIQVVRSSNYGNQYEMLTVHFMNYVKVQVALKPGIECWADGSPVTKDSFIIKTDPPGVEDEVDVAEESRIASAGMGGESHEKVYFTFRGERIRDEYATITVIENSWQWDIAGAKIDRNILKAMDAIENAGKIADRCKSVTDKIQKSSLLKKAGVEFNINPYFTANIGTKKDCCNGLPVFFFNANVHLGSEFTLGAHIPCPSFPPLHLDFGIQGALDMTLVDVNITSNVNGVNCDYDVFVPMSFDLGLYVGASLDPLEGLVTVGVKGIGGVHWNMFYYATNNSWEFKEPDLYLKIDVEANYLVGHAHWQWNVLD